MADPDLQTAERVGDEELVRRFQEGDDREAAYLELFERYVAITLAFFRRRVGDPETASDLNQELHTTVYAKLDGFRGEASYRTWLFRLARNDLWHLRRRWRVHLDETPVEVQETFWNDLPGGAPDPTDELEAHRRSGALKRCLARLTEVERLVVLGQYFEEKTLEELTREIGLTNRSGARAPLIGAQRKLRRCLEEAGVTSSGEMGGRS